MEVIGCVRIRRSTSTGDTKPLADGVDQDIVRDHQRRQGIRLVLTGLPRHRRLFKLG